MYNQVSKQKLTFQQDCSQSIKIYNSMGCKQSQVSVIPISYLELQQLLSKPSELNMTLKTEILCFHLITGSPTKKSLETLAADKRAM